MTKLLVSTIALALLGTSAAQARTAEVRHADLNLASAAGKAELDRRIERAARKVCLDETQTATRIKDHREINRCKAEVRAQVAAVLKA